MATPTPDTVDIEKWLQIGVRFFLKFWLRVPIRVRKKNAESSLSRLRCQAKFLTSYHVCMHRVIPCMHAQSVCYSYSRAIACCGYLTFIQNVLIYTSHIRKVISRLYFFILKSKITEKH